MYNNNEFCIANSEKYKFISNLYKLEFPASMLIFGEPQSGKSHFLLNLLKDVKHNFDEIIIYLGAKDSAPAFLDLIEKGKKPVIKILFNYDEKDLTTYYENLENNQEQLIKMNKIPKKVLIIADDIYSFPSFMRTNRTKPSIIEKMYANYRHLNLSIIINSQRLKQIVPSIRSMFKYGFITSLGRSDIEELSKENENIYFDKNSIIKAYEQVRKRDESKGHIFFINKHTTEKQRFQHIKPNNTIEIINP